MFGSGNKSRIRRAIRELIKEANRTYWKASLGSYNDSDSESIKKHQVWLLEEIHQGLHSGMSIHDIGGIIGDEGRSQTVTEGANVVLLETLGKIEEPLKPAPQVKEQRPEKKAPEKVKKKKVAPKQPKRPQSVQKPGDTWGNFGRIDVAAELKKPLRD